MACKSSNLEGENVKEQISIIQFRNIGAIYGGSDCIFICDYEGYKPPPDIYNYINTQNQEISQVIYLFRRMFISAPKWPFSANLEEALVDIFQIQEKAERQGEADDMENQNSE